MAGPLSGIAGGQVPLTQTPQTNQQNNTQDVRGRENEERVPAQNEIQPRQDTAAAQAQRSDDTQQKVLDQQIEELLVSAREDNTTPTTQPRGSLVDITI